MLDEIEAGLAEYEGRDDPTIHPGYHRLTNRQRKDRRRWCKGHVGREHTPAKTKVNGGYWKSWAYACTRCGRHLDSWYESPRWWPSRRVRPDWMGPPEKVV